MVKMNEIMKKILEEKEKQEGCLQIDIIVNKILNKTKEIKGCIIYDEDGILENNKINFERVIQFFGDCTGYEVSCNELRFRKESIFPCQFLVLANRLSYLLSQRYSGKKIVVYISLYEDEVELRFHTYRPDEQLWLDEDLNKYDLPILCWM